MRIIVIGASGTIGSAVTSALEGNNHEVIRASRHGPLRVDMADPGSIEALFASAHEIDAVVCCAASAQLTPLTSVSDSDFPQGLQAKLLGQVTLVRRGLHHLRDGGSITLTSGTFDQPVHGGAFGALVNGGLDAFVRAAAIEMPRGLRLNAISPGWVQETLVKIGMEGAAHGTPADAVARAYIVAVEGTMSGQTITPAT